MHGPPGEIDRLGHRARAQEERPMLRFSRSTRRFATPLLFALVSSIGTGAGAGCGDDEDEQPEATAAPDASVDADATVGTDAALGGDAAVESIRGNRYCEVLVAFLEAGSVEAQVWGTQGLNDCPESAWATVDADAVRDAFGATGAVLNGPRHWLVDEATAEIPSGSPRLFGTLEMRLLATLTLGPGMTSAMPYVERTIRRDSQFTFHAGSEVYELIAPGGSVYVMQSYARIADPDLSASDLPGLGARLALPDGWQYRARTLDAPIVVSTPGEATVVQDELQNTYSRHIVGA